MCRGRGCRGGRWGKMRSRQLASTRRGSGWRTVSCPSSCRTGVPCGLLIIGINRDWVACPDRLFDDRGECSQAIVAPGRIMVTEGARGRVGRVRGVACRQRGPRGLRAPRPFLPRAAPEGGFASRLTTAWIDPRAVHRSGPFASDKGTPHFVVPCRFGRLDVPQVQAIWNTDTGGASTSCLRARVRRGWRYTGTPMNSIGPLWPASLLDLSGLRRW